MNTPTPNAARYDLHLHTDRSDGNLSVEALITQCAQYRLDTIAITDHDFVSVPATHTRDIDGRKITVVAGAEMTGSHDGHEYHLLVYFPAEVPASFLAFCAGQTKARLHRITETMKTLDFEDPKLLDDDALQGKRSLTRHNLAKALVASGRERSLHTAFNGPLRNRSGLVPTFPTTFTEVISQSAKCGGITVWAHPPLTAVEAHLDTFVAAGLHGLEAIRPGHNRRTRKTLRRAADKHGLVVSGGSDWHGWHSRPGLFYARTNEIEGLVALLQG
jgi:predicted metal-dependent phosphoesterase TrpH